MFLKDFQIICSEKKDLEFELMNSRSKVNELNQLLMENEMQIRNHNNKTESIKRAANMAESDKREYEIKINNLLAENENLNKKIDQLLQNQMSYNDLKVILFFFFLIFLLPNYFLFLVIFIFLFFINFLFFGIE